MNRDKKIITLKSCRKARRDDGLGMKTVLAYTFPDLIEACSSRYGDRICYKVFNTDTAITYKQMREYSEAVSSSLIRLGVGKGDKVAIIGESSPMWMLMYLGIVSIGAVAVPILPDFPECDIQAILSYCSVKAIAVSRKLMQKTEGIDDIPVIRLDDLVLLDRNLPCQKLLDCPIDREGIMERKPGEQDIASIIFTSGTTGASKGVMLTHMNIIRCADLATDQYVRLKPGMKALSILPLAHVYEFTLGQIVPLMMGLEITFLGRQPAPSIVMAALKGIRPHVMFSVPLLIEKVYRSAIRPLISRSRILSLLLGNPVTKPIACMAIGHEVKRKFGGRIIFFGIGGAALDRETEEFLHCIRFPYAIGYGLTETSPLIAGCRPSHRSQKPGFIGRIVLDDDVKLINTDANGIGEIAVKGPNVMKGYYLRPDMDAEVFTDDGYFRTGDLGYLDTEGRLSIRGRVKTMILGPSGENIFPEAIESIINNQEYVDESLVIPENGGLTALVRLNLEQMQKVLQLPFCEVKDIAMDYLAQLRKEVNARVSSFARLTGIRLQESPFERTPTLKIKRFLYDGSCIQGA